MAAAAQNLTPVTLELGGKSPVIIAPGYSIATAVDRIAAGKFLNAGQTCIAPDYVLLPQASIAPFVEEMKKYVSQCYADLAANPDYSSIVNDGQYRRLAGYVDEARAAGAKVIELAPGDAGKRVLRADARSGRRRASRRDADEIFGPVLPLVAVESVDAAIDYVNARPRPLALYHFDNDAARTEKVLERTVAGGVAVNETVLHFAQSEAAVRRRRALRHGPLSRPRRISHLQQAEARALPGAPVGHGADAAAVRQARGFHREVFDALTPRRQMRLRVCMLTRGASFGGANYLSPLWSFPRALGGNAPPACHSRVLLAGIQCLCFSTIGSGQSFHSPCRRASYLSCSCKKGNRLRRRSGANSGAGP